MLNFPILAQIGKLRLQGKYYPLLEGEFTGNSPNGPFGFVAIAGGTYANRAAVKNHPGLVACIAHATNANSGALHATGAAVLLSGNEICECVFQFNVLTNAVAFIGFGDTFSAAQPTDGAYLKLSGGIIVGETSNNSTRSVTNSSFTPQLNTWYHSVIYLNDDATQAIFQIYDENGNVLWGDIISTNIPTTPGRDTCIEVVSYVTVSPGAVDLLTVDWLAMGYLKGIRR